MSRERYEQIHENFRNDAHGRLGGLRERIFRKSNRSKRGNPSRPDCGVVDGTRLSTLGVRAFPMVYSIVLAILGTNDYARVGLPFDGQVLNYESSTVYDVAPDPVVSQNPNDVQAALL